MFLGIPIKIWLMSILSVCGLMCVVAVSVMPPANVPIFLLIWATVFNTMLFPLAVIPKGNYTWWKVLIGVVYGLLWPLTISIIVATKIYDLMPEPKQ
jgi:hypothetical protein